MQGSLGSPVGAGACWWFKSKIKMGLEVVVGGKGTAPLSSLLSNPEEQCSGMSIECICNGKLDAHRCPFWSAFIPPLALFHRYTGVFQHVISCTISCRFYVLCMMLKTSSEGFFLLVILNESI